MNNGNIKAIIFDLGNVLIDFNHRIAAERVSKFTDKTGDEIYNLFFDSRLTGDFEEGKVSALQFFRELKGMLNLRLEFEEFVPIWNEIFFLSEKNHAVYNLAKNLKSRYKVALLTNINILHFAYLRQTFPIFDVFHNIITSYELGLRKPEPQIYQKTLEILDSPADSAFYTDDRPELIESARQLGIQGFVFTGVEQLRKDLLDSGALLN